MDAQMRKTVLHYTNMHRVAHGHKRLALRGYLNAAAQLHANDMSKRHYFDHDTKGGSSWDVRIIRTIRKRLGGKKDPNWAIGENIAFGQSSAKQVVDAWIASPEHNRNLLDPHFTHMGVGYAPAGKYWCQDFSG